MSNQTENIESNTIKQINTPILIKFFGTIILVTSTIVFLFFSITSIYYLFNPKFLDSIVVETNNFQYINIYVLINTFLNLGIIISTILVINLNKHALYSTIIITIIMFINEILFNNTYGYIYLSLYVVYSIILVIYIKQFK